MLLFRDVFGDASHVVMLNVPSATFIILVEVFLSYAMVFVHNVLIYQYLSAKYGRLTEAHVFLGIDICSQALASTCSFVCQRAILG
jgi:hypothetical protein